MNFNMIWVVLLAAISVDRGSAGMLEIQGPEGGGFRFFVTKDGPQFAMHGKRGAIQGHALGYGPVLELTDGDPMPRIRLSVHPDGSPRIEVMGKDGSVHVGRLGFNSDELGKRQTSSLVLLNGDSKIVWASPAD